MVAGRSDFILLILRNPVNPVHFRASGYDLAGRPLERRARLPSKFGTAARTGGVALSLAIAVMLAYALGFGIDFGIDMESAGRAPGWRGYAAGRDETAAAAWANAPQVQFRGPST